MNPPHADQEAALELSTIALFEKLTMNGIAEPAH